MAICKRQFYYNSKFINLYKYLSVYETISEGISVRSFSASIDSSDDAIYLLLRESNLEEVIRVIDKVRSRHWILSCPFVCVRIDTASLRPHKLERLLVVTISELEHDATF